MNILAISLLAFLLSTVQSVSTPGLGVSNSAVVAGTVADVNGMPVVGLEVTLGERGYDAFGVQSTFRIGGAVLTDDRGQYRLLNVPPGTYNLSVGPPSKTRITTPPTRDTLARQKLNMKYGTHYYPSTTDISKAAQIEVRTAGEIGHMDFILSPVPLRKIHGRLLMDVLPNEPVRIVASVFQDSMRQGANDTNTFSLPWKPDGSFELTDLPAGKYWLKLNVESLAILRGFPLRPRIFYEAVAEVDLGASDLENLILRADGTSVSVHVSFEGGLPLSSFSGLERLRVMLLPRTVERRGLVSPPLPSAIQPDGTIAFQKVVSAEYQLRVEGLPPNFYVKSATSGSLNVLGKWISIRAAESVLNVVLSDKAGRLEGSVKVNLSNVSRDVMVVIVPDQRQRLDLYRFVRMDPAGRFSMAGIEPGEYRIFAWDTAIGFKFFDPAFIGRVESNGNPVNITPSSTVDSTLTVIVTVSFRQAWVTEVDPSIWTEKTIL